jgi:hypothetical protein
MVGHGEASNHARMRVHSLFFMYTLLVKGRNKPERAMLDQLR